jgi:hypothetical protein
VRQVKYGVFGGCATFDTVSKEMLKSSVEFGECATLTVNYSLDSLLVAQVAGSSSVATAGVGGGGVPIWPFRGLYDAQELR